MFRRYEAVLPVSTEILLTRPSTVDGGHYQPSISLVRAATADGYALGRIHYVNVAEREAAIVSLHLSAGRYVKD